MDIAGVAVLLAALRRQHGIKIGAAAKPALRGDDHARVHMHGGDMRVLHMRDQAEARGPEAGIFAGAFHLFGEVGGEGAEHGGDMHAHLLEQPPSHHAH